MNISQFDTRVNTFKNFIFIIGLLFPLSVLSQSIKGKVSNNKQEGLIGANVYWLGTSVGTSTDVEGKFELSTKGISDKRLVARFVGFQSDTIEIKNQTFIDFSLNETTSLKEVTVTGEQSGIVVSNLSPIKTEQITQIELSKAACCDLAGCFETQISVQPQTTNVITNSKELRILGLSGIYNQVLVDGFPMIQGLSYTYGISSIPGTLVNNIFIAKGANSVLQGYESISGQINVLTQDPEKADKLLVNVYMNSFMEKQFNANYAVKKGKWSNLTAIHTTQPANKWDRDNDNFLDLPLLTRYMVFNKLKYGNSKDWGWNSTVSVRYTNEERIGGQTVFDPSKDKGSSEVYGQTVNFDQPEISTKTGYRFNDNSNLVLFASAFHQQQNSYFGTVKYDAQQTNFYSNLQYEQKYSKLHLLKAGISYRYMDLEEEVGFTSNALTRTYDGNYKKLESIPGLFAENKMQFFNKKLTWMLGARLDHHNQFGYKASPRTLLKYDLSPKTVIRANFGTGWRTANIFSENIGLLVSSRDIVFAESLNPEEAINYGLNVTQKFDKKNTDLSGYISADFYRTEFQNQIFPDYDTDPTKAIIKNFTGPSISNGFQVEAFLKFWKRFEAKVGYNYLDVYREIGGTKQTLPFNPKHKVISALSFKPVSKKFHIDATIHWYGERRLPDTKSNPPEHQRPDYSKPYTVVSAQFTYNFKRFETYIGCENIFDFRQERPIISWEDPFSPYFDTSSVWGPTRGREFYVGVKFKISKG